MFQSEQGPSNFHDLYILDEVSMVSDPDFEHLKRICRRTNSKILAVGDEYQIPANGTDR